MNISNLWTKYSITYKGMYFIIAWCNQLYVVNLERNYLIGVSIQDSSFIIFLYSEGVSWTAKFVIFIALNKFSFSQQYTTHTCTCILLHNSIADMYIAGADPGFQVRGDALKKIALSGGRHEIFLGISCEKSRFYAKKSYFFQYFTGGACQVRPPPPRSAPALYKKHLIEDVSCSCMYLFILFYIILTDWYYYIHTS
jgi:hypothetical protein